MKRKFLALTFTITFVALIIDSCKKFEPKAPKADEVMDAPIEGLNPAQNKLFLEGAEEFDEAYTTTTGLGPVFVANSCSGCHAGDNRGHLFTALTRFGQTDSTGNKFMQFGAPQIQHRAMFGHTPEQLPQGATFSKFLAPIASGVGFLELVSDADLLAMSDPNDANADGISGVPCYNTIPNWVQPFPNAIPKNGKLICRFGRKASTYNLLQQTVGAFNQDMGITTTFMPMNPFNYLDGMYYAPGIEPELPDQSVNATVFYMKTLQAPIQRNQNDPKVQYGKTIFNNIGCESCHKQTLKTSFSPITPMSEKEFHPYTDLLLHDMGSGLDDFYTEGTAKTYEWRTTPLWGLGLAPGSQGGSYFLMHDGRAHSIEEAILMHGGESLKSKNNFETLSKSDREALVAFLKSL